MPLIVQRDTDAALLAVFLMSRYEDTMHTHEHEESPLHIFKSAAHHDGAAAILKIWLEGNLNSNGALATDIIKYSRRGVIRSHLLRHLAVPLWLSDGAQFGECGPVELEYDRLLVGVASLRHQFKSLEKSLLARQRLNRELISWMQSLISEAGVLSKAFEDWATRIPSTWHPQRHLLPAHYALPRRHFFSSIVYSYSSIAYAATWLNFFATAMLLNRTRLKILELIRPSSNDLGIDQERQEEDCCSKILSMAHDLSCSIPFTLDRFSVADSSKTLDGHAVTLNSDDEIKPYIATLVAWPLSLAASIGDLDLELKNWLREELLVCGKVIGTGVLQCAHSYHWFEI